MDEENRRNRLNRILYKAHEDKEWEKVVPPPTEIRVLKHRLNHIFLPVDIDLQGLRETDFKEAYWKEVASEYKGRGLQLIKDAQSIIYGDNVDEGYEHTVEERNLNEIITKLKLEELESWKKIKEMLPPTLETLPNGLLLLLELSKGNKVFVKKNCEIFQYWYKEFDELLDTIQRRVDSTK